MYRDDLGHATPLRGLILLVGSVGCSGDVMAQAFVEFGALVDGQGASGGGDDRVDIPVLVTAAHLVDSSKAG